MNREERLLHLYRERGFIVAATFARFEAGPITLKAFSPFAQRTLASISDQWQIVGHASTVDVRIQMKGCRYRSIPSDAMYYKISAIPNSAGGKP